MPRIVWIPLLLLLFGALGGCATGPTSPLQALPARDCLQFYSDLDEAVAIAGVRDASAAAIPGYPFLRSNRFLASFRDELEDTAHYRQWIAALARLDLELRRLELDNLPADRHAVPTARDGEGAGRWLEQCSGQLAREVQQDRRHLAVLQNVVEVPDNYLTWRRVVGLYPLASLLAHRSVIELHKRLQQPFLLPPGELPLRGRLVRYRPFSGGQPTSLSSRLQEVEPSLLGITPPDQPLLDRLFQRFAPIIEIDTLNEADHIGHMGWDKDGSTVVDTDQPVVYRYPSYTRFRERTLLQLNYLFWFPARDTGDIYSGHLDAVIWRVTLDTHARPLAYDSIHGCGCYYQLLPALGYQLRPLSTGEEPVLVPMTAPAWQSTQRLILRLAAGTHYLQAVYSDMTRATAGIPYQLLDYRDLLSLSLPGGGRRSLFGPDGLVAGSERAERYLLWSFGVLSPGAMRQPGTHAIAFIGRRHFDDHRLLESLLRAERGSEGLPVSD